MSWFQQNTGYFVVLAFVALIVIGFFARRAARRYQNGLIERSRQMAAEGGEAGIAGAMVARAAKASTEGGLGTVASFAASRAQVLAALGTGNLPGGWKLEAEGLWAFSGSKINGQKPTAAALIDVPGGAQLVLLRSEDIAGVAIAEGVWRSVRGKAVDIAKRAGIDASEIEGPALERHPVGDVSGLTPEKLAHHKHVWLRPGHTV